jgi:gamma-glutamyltranspeptidase/glutathione hydrolase
MNLQAALEAPRFLSRDPAPTCRVTFERRLPVDIRDGLAKLGHEIQLTDEYWGIMGIGQGVIFDSKSSPKYGASDPRGDGAAIPEPLPW